MKKNKKVAIVDDDQFLLKMYATKFKKEGYEVVTYTNGQDAIEGIKEEQPGVVLLDIIMPGVDGIKVLQVLKDDKKTSGIPVVLLTNLDGEEVRKEGAKSGALYFVNKAAFLPKTIVEMVGEILSD